PPDRFLDTSGVPRNHDYSKAGPALAGRWPEPTRPLRPSVIDSVVRGRPTLSHKDADHELVRPDAHSAPGVHPTRHPGHAASRTTPAAAGHRRRPALGYW